jgi:uncharacterized small protein (DUF1192 family)
VFPLLLLVAGALIAKFYPARRDVAAAGLADAQGWDLLIENLREEVVRLEAKLERVELRERESTRSYEAQIAVLRREVARLQRTIEPPG